MDLQVGFNISLFNRLKFISNGFFLFLKGTGKTHLGVEITREIIYQHYRDFGTNPRILFVAPSDSALNEIVKRLLLVSFSFGTILYKNVRIIGSIFIWVYRNIHSHSLFHGQLAMIMLKVNLLVQYNPL